MPSPYTFAAAILLLLAIQPCNSQTISIDKTDTLCYSNKAQWDGNIALGLEVDKQQATLFDASNFVDVSLQQKHELYIFSASNRFTYNGPEDVLNTGYVHLRWRHGYKEQLHPETYVQYQWDNKRGIVHRFVTGANLRYNFWHHKMWELTFASGLMYENERWDYSGVDTNKIPLVHPDIQTNVLKSNNYIKWDGRISSASNIAIALFYQASFKDFFEPRVMLNVNLDVNVSKHFAVGFRYAGLDDVQPIVPISHFYYTLSNNIIYKF